MTIYFVDFLKGLDSNMGTTRAGAWKTWDKVLAGISARVIGRGDKIGIIRGDKREMFGGLNGFGTSAPYVPHLVVEAVGSGKAPRILGYKDLDIEASWTNLGDNRWRIDLSAAAGAAGGYTGNITNDSSNIGALLVDGELYGAYKTTVSALAEQWDFTYDQTAKTFTVWSASNPAAMTQSLRATPRGSGLLPGTATTFLGLEFEGWGAHGWRVQDGVGDVVVRNCSFINIGGSTNGEGSRYGNGNENWIGSYSIVDEHNLYRNIYDVGATEQGPVESGRTSWEDIVHQFNTYVNCNQTHEIWSTGVAPDGGMKNVKFRFNVAINSGYSWGGGVRPDKLGKGNHLMSYSVELPCDVEVYGNVFAGALDAYRFHRHKVSSNPDVFTYLPPVGYNSHDNLVLLNRGTKLSYFQTQTIEAFEAWRAALGTEAGSEFIAIEDNLEAAIAALAKGSAKRVLDYLASQTTTAGAVARIAQMAAAETSAEVASLRSLVQHGMSGLRRDPLVTGSLYMPQRASSTATYALQVNTARGPRWEVVGSGKISKLVFEITTAGGAGSLVRAAVLRMVGALGYELVADLGTVSAETTGFIEVPANFHVRESEDLILMLVGQGSGTMPTVRGLAGLSDPKANTSNISYLWNSTALVTGWQVSGVTSAFPASGTLGLTTDTPRVGVVAG